MRCEPGEDDWREDIVSFFDKGTSMLMPSLHVHEPLSIGAPRTVGVGKWTGSEGQPKKSTHGHKQADGQ